MGCVSWTSELQVQSHLHTSSEICNVNSICLVFLVDNFFVYIYRPKNPLFHLVYMLKQPALVQIMHNYSRH